MLWKLTQRTFNGGQLDKRLMGRTDLAKYYEGASVLENFIVKRQGCIVKRRGTVEVADFTAATGCAAISDYRLFPFSFESDGGYVVAFVEDAQLGRKAFVFSKAGAVVATLAIPYAGTDFAQISYDQSGDMLYLAHQGYPFARITRHAESDWRYEAVDFELCGHAALPETPTITGCSLLPAGSWTGTGPSKTIYYIVTAVKDGVESRPSDPYAVSYNTPWPEGSSVKVEIAAQSPAPDYYNVYKKADAYTGLVGTTSSGTSVTGQEAVTTLPTGSGCSKEYAGRTAPRTTFSGRVESSSERNDATNYGYVVEGGVYTATYATALDADQFCLGLGYVWYGMAIGTVEDCRYYIQFLPCNCAVVRAVATFADGTTQDMGLLSVPDAAKATICDNSVTGNPYSSGVGAAIAAKRTAMAQGAKLVWNVQNRQGRKVKSVTFTAYSDSAATTVAAGSVGNMSVSGPAWATVNGYPFTICGFWARKNATATVNELVDEYVTADASLTPPAYEPHFEDTGKYPGCVALYQQRLALARTVEQPFTFWLSCIGDLYNFNVHDSLREDDAMEVTLPATKYPDINHMILNRDLIMFCDSGEWIVAPTSGAALTYKTISTKIQSQIGCSKTVKPIAVNDDVVFANMTAETLVATKYSYATDGYEATDLSVLSQDVFRGNAIVSLAYKQHPDSILVATLEDGSFATLEYMKEHEVVAWSRHELGGGLKARDCCADGSVTSGTTDVYILAEDPNAAGGQSFLLLRVKEDAPLTTVGSAVSMDQMSTVATAGTVPAGFVAVNALTGETLAAGASRAAGATYVQGRPFAAVFVSVKPEPSPSETVQFEVKNPTEVEIRVNEGSTFRVGQYGLPEAKDRTVKLEPEVTAATGAIRLQTADKAALVAGANNRDGRIRLTSDGVWPLTVLSISTTYQIEKANQEPQKVPGGGDAS